MKCFICGQKELIRNTYKTFQGQKICPDCMRERTIKCAVCGRIVSAYTRTRDLNEINKGGWSLVELGDKIVHVCPKHSIAKCPECTSLVVQDYNTHVSDNTCDECAPFTHIQDFITKKFFHKNVMELVHRPNDYDVWAYTENIKSDEYTLQTCIHCNSCWLFTKAEWQEYERTWQYTNQFACNSCAKLMKLCSCCGDMYVPSRNFEIIYDEDFKEDSEVLESSQAYCPSCLEEVVRLYHSNRKEKLTFHNMKKSITRTFGDDAPTPDIYLGMELEVDTADPNITVEQVRLAAMRVQEYFGPTFLAITKDSSLNKGFEMITSPMTLDVIHFRWDDLKQLCLIPKKFGLRSHDAETCGLHVHISREPLVEPNRLEQLVVWFWPELAVFSRRVRFDYCDSFWVNTQSISAEELYKLKLQENHYYAVNGGNQQTIELRLWRGSLKPETVLAALEMSHYLADLCCVTSVKYRAIIQGGWDTFVQNISKDKFPNLINYLEHIESKIKKAQNYFTRSKTTMSYNWGTHKGALIKTVETDTKF